MAKLTLHPSGKVLEVDEEINILERLKSEEIYIRSSCGGNGSCSDCMIKVLTGDNALSPPPFEEIQLLGNVFHLTKERLACQLKINGDVTIDISHHNLEKDQKRRESKNKDFVKSKIKLKKKEQVDKEKQERESEKAQYHKTRDEWKGHWKNKDTETSKRLGGAKRPKLFNTPEIESEENDIADTETSKELKDN